jgi:hypothetical protein
MEPGRRAMSEVARMLAAHFARDSEFLASLDVGAPVGTAYVVWLDDIGGRRNRRRGVGLGGHELAQDSLTCRMCGTLFDQWSLLDPCQGVGTEGGRR